MVRTGKDRITIANIPVRRKEGPVPAGNLDAFAGRTDDETGDMIVKVRFTYEKGRGYNLYVQPMIVKTERGISSESYMMFSGKGIQTEKVARFNEKHFCEAATKVMENEDVKKLLAYVMEWQHLECVGQ